MLLAAAIVTASPPSIAPAEHRGVVIQAVAMVRVISGIRLNLDGTNNGSAAPLPREAILTSGGVKLRAKLIEFQ
jgi:hypothetical protein